MFPKVKNGTSVIKNRITDGFHHILPSRFQLEEKAMPDCHCKGIIIYKETDGDGHVYLRPFLQFLLLVSSLANRET